MTMIPEFYKKRFWIISLLTIALGASIGFTGLLVFHNWYAVIVDVLVLTWAGGSYFTMRLKGYKP